VCSIIKKEGVFKKKICLALDKFCAYIGPLGYPEIVVFNYNKIYEEVIGPNETHY